MNVNKSVLELARSKYAPMSVPIACLVEAIDAEIMEYGMHTQARAMISDPLAAYTLGLNGEEGYMPLMLGVDMSHFKHDISRQVSLVRYNALFMVLVSSLNALGERIEY